MSIPQGCSHEEEAKMTKPPSAAPGLGPLLTDSMIMQMLGEATAAERRAGEDALTIGCTPQQVYELELAARCETIRSYLYQAGILGPLAERDARIATLEAELKECKAWRVVAERRVQP